MRISGAGMPTSASSASAFLRAALSDRSEEHTSELQSRPHLVCRLLLEKKKHQPTSDESSTQSSHSIREQTQQKGWKLHGGRADPPGGRGSRTYDAPQPGHYSTAATRAT